MKTRGYLNECREAERLLAESANRGDYILAAVGIVGCVVIVILAALGLA